VEVRARVLLINELTLKVLSEFGLKSKPTKREVLMQFAGSTAYSLAAKANCISTKTELGTVGGCISV
jgi:hypothetical protein